MRNKTIIALWAFALALCAGLFVPSMRANAYPEVYRIPPTSNPPWFDPHGPSTNPVFDGSNYWWWWGGGLNSLGVYLEPGYYDYDPSTIGRDVEVVVTDPPPAPRPAWAIFDPEPDGTYYWGGGYYNGHYYAEGYYFPTEIV